MVDLAPLRPPSAETLAALTEAARTQAGDTIEVSLADLVEVLAWATRLTRSLPPSDEDWVEVVYKALRDHMNAHGPFCSNNLAQATLTALKPLLSKVREEGAAAERASIVAWLNDEASMYLFRAETCSDDMVDEFTDLAEHYRETAAHIQSGVHIRGEGAPHK